MAIGTITTMLALVAGIFLLLVVMVKYASSAL
jgi:hypothetical protein